VGLAHGLGLVLTHDAGKMGRSVRIHSIDTATITFPGNGIADEERRAARAWRIDRAGPGRASHSVRVASGWPRTVPGWRRSVLGQWPVPGRWQACRKDAQVFQSGPDAGPAAAEFRHQRPIGRALAVPGDQPLIVLSGPSGCRVSDSGGVCRRRGRPGAGRSGRRGLSSARPRRPAGRQWRSLR
jgi:hypothetical protein